MCNILHTVYISSTLYDIFFLVQHTKNNNVLCSTAGCYLHPLPPPPKSILAIEKINCAVFKTWIYKSTYRVFKAKAFIIRDVIAGNWETIIFFHHLVNYFAYPVIKLAHNYPASRLFCQENLENH